MPRTWNRLHRTLALAAALVAASAVSASAQTSYSSYGPSLELTVFNGYYIASDLYTSVGAGGGADIGLENSYMYGGRIGFYPRPIGGLELAYTRTGSDVKVNSGAAGYDPGTLGRVDLDNFDINFVFSQANLANPRVSAFFTFGFGWTITDPQLNIPIGATADGGETFFAWNLGLGTKIAMSEALALRLEGRWKTTDTNFTTSSGVYCDYWGYCYQYASDWYNSGEFTAGLTYKIGR